MFAFLELQTREMLHVGKGVPDNRLVCCRGRVDPVDVQFDWE